ncbi:hypothetical protein BG000_008433 [Podila horticola]|nr:hypothetical protein BG000_008433 [Podila horticola]
MQAGGKNQVQILEELHGFEEQAHEWDHQNIYWNTLNVTENIWDYPSSNLFVILPSDLDSWNDSDPSTHQFRLYFLCNPTNRYHATDESLLHTHFSDHPGYHLKRPNAFIQNYGNYMLRVLLMIKHGYTGGRFEIPPQDTFKILWNRNPDVSGSHLTKETLGRLMDKTIAHLQDQSSLNRNKQLSLTRVECAMVKTFLDVQEGDNAEGNMNRWISSDQYVYWGCQAHTLQHYQTQNMKGLRKVISGLGGDIDIKRGRLHVELNSAVQASQFRTALQGAKHIFDISLKFCWPATQSVVQELGHGIGKTGTVTLEIEGLSPDIYPGGYMQPLCHFFYFPAPSDVWLKYVTLLNYPRPQEQCIRIGSLSLRSTLTPERTGLDWIALSSDFEEQLRLVLERHGFLDATLATIYDFYWIAAFDLEQAAFVEAYSTNMSCPNAILASGSLRKLVVHIHDEEDESWFFNVVQSNNFLQELKLTHFRDEPQDAQVAQMTIRGCGKDLPGGSTREIHETSGNRPSTQQQGQNIPVEIEFLRWESDHIFTPVSDYIASILDMATCQHPLVPSAFVLDISQLSSVGLAAIQRILGRSSLEHFSIVCDPFNSSMSDTIAQVLGAIQWDTLKSLVLSGDCINEWLQLWPFTTAPRLLCLEIRVSESANKPLSHQSVLFVHQAIYASALLELHLENIQLQDRRDWSFMVDSLDPLCVATFVQCKE